VSYPQLERERDELRAEVERLKTTEMWVTDAWIPKTREAELQAELSKYRKQLGQLSFCILRLFERAEQSEAEVERLKHENLQWQVGTERALELRRAEVERLRAQNAELHRQIEYTRDLAWDDIPDKDIVGNLRRMLDRPKE